MQENGYETEIKSFGKCFVQKILRKELAFLERKQLS
jgi:hypothetical protein